MCVGRFELSVQFGHATLYPDARTSCHTALQLSGYQSSAAAQQLRFALGQQFASPVGGAVCISFLRMLSAARKFVATAANANPISDYSWRVFRQPTAAIAVMWW
jgi:hypothetical protein